MRQTGVLRSKFIWRASAFLFVAALLLSIQQGAHAEGDEAGNNLTSQCKITLPERSAGFAARLSDNRYNSLDFRFFEQRARSRALDPGDPASVQYPSILSPFPLDLKFIEGYTIFRAWPPSRVGLIK